MSMQEGTSDQAVVSKVLEDQAFVASVLASVCVLQLSLMNF